MQCGALLTRAAVARLYLVVLNVDTHRCWAPDYYTNYAQFRRISLTGECSAGSRFDLALDDIAEGKVTVQEAINPFSEWVIGAD
ncbi:hypothetical protein ZEAMMB73_Zm00001d033051 [Zea mays]|uniref:Uncharacterized protein n=1 Tax=Zea mays TaxID=4577 RepID=A0A1D6KW28_MAIZE|nr:hypothetical protein ZEAMMB73_Zm00001d033051 [Zea mays]ONM06686.1 hypothetical protein ZEAMMB73_Zm00001d033051 [Zea mays]